jgi:hypothetical protein
MNIRIILFLICLLTTSGNLLAQISEPLSPPDTNRRVRTHFIAFKAGGSIPLGAYGRTHRLDAGNAVPGMVYGAEMGLISRRLIGFGISGGYFRNRHSTFEGIQAVPGNMAADGNRDTYQSLYLMAGPYLTLPAKRFFVDFKVLGGWLRTWAPSFRSSLVLDGVRTNLNIFGYPASTFAYNPGVNVRLRTGSQLQFMAGLDYIYGKPQLRYAASTFNIQNPGSLRLLAEEVNHWQTVSVFNLSWGLAFAF